MWVCRAVAEHLSKDLPYKLSPDDVYITISCLQATEIILAVLSSPGVNILLPRPIYPYYEARAAFNHLHVYRFDLLPDKRCGSYVNAMVDDKEVGNLVLCSGDLFDDISREDLLMDRCLPEVISFLLLFLKPPSSKMWFSAVL
ncbi:hypothetical protein RJ641_015527 [Dillenia turbinata]|uniref:Aminotransferase class I/classII domain-containing protein n=1 Tax=Dillenia turbinata TaxID=194707 RepID=A0AAN8Z3S9_9MAGN